MTARDTAILVIGSLLIASVVAFATPPAHGAECGKASFYAEQHQGKIMANGKPFNMHAMTAASWYYPLGTKVSVKAGRRSVTVIITDRGPAKRLHRIIDLSKAAFAQLAPTGQGLVKACVSMVG